MRMAFFFTMPIRRMMPMKETRERSKRVASKREQRADTGRGQGREDSDGMDEALVQHPQHDIDGDQRGEHQERRAGQRGLKTWAVPWKLPCTLAGMCSSSTACWTASVACAQRSAQGKVEGNGHRRELALVIDGKIGVAGLEFGQRPRAAPAGRWLDLT